LLTDPDNRQGGVLTAAGKAFTRVQTWMHGTMVGTTTKRPCIADRHGTYTCLIRYAHGVGRVYWNPYRTAKIKMVRSARHKTNEYGTTTAAHGGKRLKVTYRPILVKSKR
jgi:polysaccharide biosynthesis protein PslG